MLDRQSNQQSLNQQRTGSENGEDDITGSLLASPLTIELANESVTGEFAHESEVIGARWTLDSGGLELMYSVVHVLRGAKQIRI